VSGGRRWEPILVKDVEIGVPSKPLISIVDDEESVRAALHGLIRSMGFNAAAFASGADFINSIPAEQCACVIADVHMPGMTGPELHQALLARGSNIPVILVTAYPDERVREQALRAGVICYLTKPFDDNELIACLRAALGRTKRRRS
jgi:FixJ family two-component response regulator